jgi:hypothetical protein
MHVSTRTTKGYNGATASKFSNSDSHVTSTEQKTVIITTFKYRGPLPLTSKLNNNNNNNNLAFCPKQVGVGIVN